MEVKIKPWNTPNFLIGEMPTGKHQNGFNSDNAPKWHVSEVDAQTLSDQCDVFRAEIFDKAGMKDPNAEVDLTLVGETNGCKCGIDCKPADLEWADGRIDLVCKRCGAYLKIDYGRRTVDGRIIYHVEVVGDSPAKKRFVETKTPMENNMTTTKLELGHGDVSICAVKADDGNHGVLFMHDPGVEIGATTGQGGRTENEKRHVFLQITSTCPESLDVLIGHLQSARDFFNADFAESTKEIGQEESL